MSTILGFDVSSTCIGYCVLELKDSKINFISCDYIKPIKDGNLINRLADTRDKIKNIINDVKPDFIAIEDIISFMAGGSTAKTIITLTSFNRMICLCAYDYLGKSPELLSIMTIRSNIKKELKLQKNPKKEDIPEALEKILKINFPWELNKKGDPKKENYDMSDSIAVAYCLANKLKNKASK